MRARRPVGSLCSTDGRRNFGRVCYKRLAPAGRPTVRVEIDVGSCVQFYIYSLTFDMGCSAVWYSYRQCSVPGAVIEHNFPWKFEHNFPWSGAQPDDDAPCPVHAQAKVNL